MSEETLLELRLRQAETEAALCSLEILARGIRRDPDTDFGTNTCNIIEGMTRIVRRCHTAAFDVQRRYLEELEKDKRNTDTGSAAFRRRQAAAHAAVAAAIADDTLSRPFLCERCRGLPESIIAHHHDYDKPLDVEWLCRPCHGKHHAEHGSAT